MGFHQRIHIVQETEEGSTESVDEHNGPFRFGSGIQVIMDADVLNRGKPAVDRCNIFDTIQARSGGDKIRDYTENNEQDQDDLQYTLQELSHNNHLLSSVFFVV